MREIKFRAWDSDKKRYMYDVEHEYDGENLCSFAEALDDPSLIAEQYTGLKDKDGKEIYEGDIVNFYYVWTDDGPSDDDPQEVDYTGRVLYDTDMGVYGIDCEERGFLLGSVVQDYGNAVIGNIHEDPELLGGRRHGS